MDNTPVLTLRPIAYARNGFTDKFGIPRQVQQDTLIRTRIVFCPAYRSLDALRGIEGFTHLWLLWGFHEVPQTTYQRTPQLTVRPPRLGGNVRMGVFATRSPYRPNPIGLTSVRLVAIEHTPAEGTVLLVEGADMLDGTPIYDIKPYLRYCDSHPDAADGFAGERTHITLAVQWPANIPDACPLAELEEILRQDPRPGYQQDDQRLYGLDYAGWNVQFKVAEETVLVQSLHKNAKK